MKRFFSLVLAAFFALQLAACGSENKVETSFSPSSSSPSSSSPSSSQNDSSNTDSSVKKPASSGSSNTGSSGTEAPKPVPEKPDLPESYRAYDKLSLRQQEYYTNMLAGIENMQTGWIVLGEADENYQADIAIARTAVLVDHPEIFWLPSYYATAEAVSSAGIPTAVIYFSTDAESAPAYLYTAHQKEKMMAELNKAAENLLKKVTATNPYDAELQIHDLLCAEIEYSDDPTDPAIYTAYGALINKKALCEGYSKAMQLLLEKWGMAATTVTGVAEGEDHMWNRVFLGGEWYNLDLTWDDLAGDISHEYFNLSDEMFSYDHTFHPVASELDTAILVSGTAFNIVLPLAEGTEFNYFNHSGFVLFSDGASSLAAYLTRTKTDFIEVRFANKAFRDQVFEHSDEFISLVNDALLTEQANCGFTVGGYSVSSMVLRLYKKKI